ncbi:hypothetical protein A3C37_03640 [Candidatus Peribacteria bacterium RIFCSPHIGHO2_02_FULL_53_20]|nr:MAG: hypothetical protein A3C37_03640 [Candidatus Peribacteria bacterium RIFCSPHIGHO2_02_FULL_53_20]
MPHDHHRLFSAEHSLQEHRMIFFATVPELPGSKEPCKDKPKKLPSTSDALPIVPVLNPVVEPTKEPDFSEVKFNMRQDEPSHIYNEKRSVVENPSHEISNMNQEQFKVHLKTMFKRHMSDQMKQERSRQHRLARGRRRAESRDRFSDRKSQRAWAEKALQNTDAIYSEAEQEFQNIKQTPEALFGTAEFEGMLEQITTDIWSTAEFQRGTVDYLKAYDKAWALYMDMAKQQTHEKGIQDHPLFQSGSFQQKRAPGIYQNGELVRVPSTFIGNRPSSTYAAAKVRERAGVSQNPDRDFLKKEEAVVRGGYEKGWRHTFRKRNPLGSAAEEDAYIQKLVDQNLKKQGFRQVQIDRTKLPDPDHLRLPSEATAKNPKEYRNAHQNIDARDRSAVVSKLVKALDLGKTVTSLQDFHEKVTLNEVELGIAGAGMPQILRFSTNGTTRRGELSGVRSGVAFVDRVGKKETEKPDVHVLEFSKVDHMLETLAKPPFDILMKSDVFTEQQWKVLDVLDDLKSNGHAYDHTETYLLLIRKCQEKMIGGSALSGFALDEIREMYDLMPRIEATPAELKKIFGSGTLDKDYLMSIEIEKDPHTRDAFRTFTKRHPKQKTIAEVLLKSSYNDDSTFDAWFTALNRS